MRAALSPAGRRNQVSLHSWYHVAACRYRPSGHPVRLIGIPLRRPPPRPSASNTATALTLVSLLTPFGFIESRFVLSSVTRSLLRRQVQLHAIMRRNEPERFVKPLGIGSAPVGGQLHEMAAALPRPLHGMLDHGPAQTYGAHFLIYPHPFDRRPPPRPDMSTPV